MKKTVKISWNIAFGLASTLLLVAQVKKDFRTHAEHEDHNPCECNRQCLRCAF